MVEPNQRRTYLMVFVVFMAAIMSCGGLARPTPTPTPTLVPTVTITPAAATAIPLTPTPTLPSTWQDVLPGLALRGMTFDVRDDSPPAQATLVRIDPHRYTFRIAYAPDTPATVAEWQAQTGGLVVINAGFFQEGFQTAGLLAADGAVFGVSFDQIDAQYYEFGGMFSVTGGMPRLRMLGTAPYQPGEPLDQAVQGLPMLLDTGGVPVAFDLPDRTARRTVVAVDDTGSVILISVPGSLVSLYDLRDWLAGESELQLDTALNLDGGQSTGLVLEAGAWLVQHESWSKVPSVLVIEPVD
ncbi:MAG: phosphodiester glycosidase family protein [Anaerolineae bacterium]|nr:phosphodiester glycosidase family protein [Anaerolineae bacterium]